MERTVLMNESICREHDLLYSGFLDAVRKSNNEGYFFTTDVKGLWEIYLNSFTDSTERQIHNCNICRYFFERYGGLVKINRDGKTESAFWKSYVDGYPMRELRSAVENAKVTGVFYSPERTLGTPKTGMWSHISFDNPYQMANTHDLTIEKRNAFDQVRSFVVEYPMSDVERAVDFLKSGSLRRPEKVLPAAEWLLDICRAKKEKKGKAFINSIWLAVATAPDGFCHPRASVLGSLVEDIHAGLDGAAIVSRFNDKMEPDLYQRPQAPPKAGNIDAAEKLVEKLGVAKSLVRRFARLEELELLWKPEEQRTEGGVFGKLKENNASKRSAIGGAQNITAVRFMRDVIPQAVSMRVEVPHRGNFFAFVSADDMDAPPILQWDFPERRNPISLYCYVNESRAGDWGLVGSHADCTGAVRPPAMWYGAEMRNHKDGLFFILKGCADKRNSSSALFPEILKPELREIRSTIEAYSHKTPLLGFESATACGINAVGTKVIVMLKSGLTVTYNIVMWE